MCCGSVTFWYGTRSADPYLWLTDPDPAIFFSDLQDGNKNERSKVFCLLLFKGTFHHFSKIKVIKKSRNSRNQDFLITLQMLTVHCSWNSCEGSTQLDSGPQRHGLDIEDCILVTLTEVEEWVGAEWGLEYWGTVSASPGSSLLQEQRLYEQTRWYWLRWRSGWGRSEDWSTGGPFPLHRGVLRCLKPPLII